MKSARVLKGSVDPEPAEPRSSAGETTYDGDLLDHCVDARAFQVVAWSLQFGRRADDPSVAAHLEWLLARDGDGQDA